MLEKSDTSVRLFSYDDDQPLEGQGVLIPRKGSWRPQQSAAAQSRKRVYQSLTRAGLFMVALFAFVILGTTGYGIILQGNIAAPIVTIMDKETQNTASLNYGPQEALSKNTIFEETRSAFIDEGLTFIEVDVAKQQLRFFQKGVLLQSTEVLAIGAEGSWWDTPSGLYQVEKKDTQLFTTGGQVYLPWLLTFQGNYVIHGWPEYPDKTPVSDDFAVGGIRISNEAAEALYDTVFVDTPVLVHAAPKARDSFVFQPQVVEIKDAEYFIADLGTDTILAASDVDKEVPIASVTKLMTAVVTTEQLNLDGRIRATSPTFVTSLIPRLSEQSSVSTYSLLQLLLVESSNEAAETLAGEVGREAFISAMNDKARQLGMMHTTFADPSGLSADNVSTAGDLYILAKYIFENKRFLFDITAESKLPNIYSDGEFEDLVNFNVIEGMDSFVGGKVGETLAAGQTSVSLHTLPFQGEERTIVVIVLGSDDRTADVETLLLYVENRFAG
jgi:D-alanyl-D-alanine endopeptidase (penicillin-binding protein 7)